MRKGSPYLISANTQLQSEDGALVQRGDLLATLIFERQKTGDIVQGLPRVEELLEAVNRKNAPSSLREPVKPRSSSEDDVTRLFVVYGEGNEEEIVIPAGLNVIVEDGEEITPGLRLLMVRLIRTMSCA